MADNLDGKSNSLLLGLLLGAAAVALGVLPYSITSGGTSRWSRSTFRAFPARFARTMAAKTSLSVCPP